MISHVGSVKGGRGDGQAWIALWIAPWIAPWIALWIARWTALWISPSSFIVSGAAPGALMNSMFWSGAARPRPKMEFISAWGGGPTHDTFVFV